MKHTFFILVSTLTMLITTSVEARDDRLMFSVKDAMSIEKAKNALDGDIRFYFGAQKHPKILKDFGEVMTNKKTNAFNKTDQGACQWAFLSAMVSFQNRVVREGGNAVVNIRSYYKRKEVSSETEFECGAGKFVAGVTFKGDIVKLAK